MVWLIESVYEAAINQWYGQMTMFIDQYPGGVAKCFDDLYGFISEYNFDYDIYNDAVINYLKIRLE